MSAGARGKRTSASSPARGSGAAARATSAGAAGRATPSRTSPAERRKSSGTAAASAAGKARKADRRRSASPSLAAGRDIGFGAGLQPDSPASGPAPDRIAGGRRSTGGSARAAAARATGGASRSAAREPAASPFWELPESRQAELLTAEDEAVEAAEPAPRKKPLPTIKRSKEEEEYYRKKLLDLRESIVKNLEGLREELRGLQEPSHELEEWAQEEKERDILILQEQRQEEELTRVQVALQRLEERTYGLCARCGRKITKARLEEIPTAVFCLDHQP